MATAKNEEQQPVEGASARSAFLFEMDSVALGARRIRYEVLASILKEQRIELTPVLFSRYCLHPAPSVYMPAFLAAMKYTAATPEQVVDRLMGETTSRLMQKTTVISAVPMSAPSITARPPAVDIRPWPTKEVISRQVAVLDCTRQVTPRPEQMA